MTVVCVAAVLFFFNDTATTEIYTLSLHDALPISEGAEDDTPRGMWFVATMGILAGFTTMVANAAGPIMVLYLLAMRLRSEEHTSELQSRQYLVCRLLLEKKNKTRQDACRIGLQRL